jgi:PadR family transcriptional regulator, regulatory protein PadR
LNTPRVILKKACCTASSPNNSKTFLDRQKERDQPVPRFVEREFALAVEVRTEGARDFPLAYRGERVYSSITEVRTMSKPKDLVQGTLDLLIMKILALGQMHGWAISQRLKQVSGDVLQVSDGSLYPALHKLEQEGWIKAEWAPSENNRRAKYYSLTRLGRKELEKEAANWTRLASAITQVVNLTEA